MCSVAKMGAPAATWPISGRPLVMSSAFGCKRMPLDAPAVSSIAPLRSKARK